MSVEYHNLAVRCSHLSLSRTAYLFVYSPPELELTNTYFEVIEFQKEPLTVTFSTGGYPDPIYSERFDWLVVAMYHKLGMYQIIFIISRL